MNNLDKRFDNDKESIEVLTEHIRSGETVESRMDHQLHIRDLFHIIFKKLHPLYQIDCGALLLYNEEITVIKQAYISEYSPAIQDVITETISNGIRLDAILAEIAGFEFPVLKTKQEWEAEYDVNHSLLNNNSEYLFHCYIPLEKNNQILGTLELHNRNKALSTEGLSFCSNIADMFAEIIYLLLNPEKQDGDMVDRSMKEKKSNSDFMSDDLQILFSLSNAITAIRNKEDLKSVIKGQFKQFSFLCEIIISTVNADGDTYSTFLINTSTNLLNDPSFVEAIDKKHPLKDGIFNTIAASPEPVVFDLEELAKRDELPGYLRIWQGSGNSEIIGLSLMNGIDLVGVLYLFMKDKNKLKPHQLSLVKAVSCQISIALANILIHEDMVRKNDEKAKLLALGYDLSGARTKHDIDRIMLHQLKQLFNFDQFTIRLINDDQKTHDIYLCSVKDFNSFTKAGLMKKGLYTTDDYIFKMIGDAGKPVIFNINKGQLNVELPGYVHFWQANGILQIIGSPIYRGSEMIGVFMINLSEERTSDSIDLSLLQGVAVQISFALANVIAYDRINMQLEEINNYKQQLEDEKLYLQEEIQINSTYDEIIGQGAQMQRVFQLLTQVGRTETTVLILGETGTGKELIARAIHNDSERKGKIMVKVNCAAIPANLIESELFGHEKGSFTGATERRIGKFELANNSTLFLDEIGDLPLDLQVKLLRVLQEKEFERVGGTTTIKTDVRIVSATNRDLREEVEAGRFRRDLFYRLNVFPVQLPPLRNRKEDIPLLANYFLNRYARKTGKIITGFSQKALNEIKNYHWPGNIRELEHLIERQVLLTKSQMIKEMGIPSAARAIIVTDNEITTIKTIDENERDHIFEVLKLCRGKVSGADGAAKLLGVPATTLNSKIKRLGLTKTHLY